MTIKATHRLIESVWTLEYRRVAPLDGFPLRVEIVRYSRTDPDGYEKERHLAKLDHVHERDERIVEAVTINGVYYTVTNPRHIFSYGG